MKTETIEKKCGFFGMLCILSSITIGFLIALGALVTLIVCVCKCLF